jgi:hypothetical protein
MAIDLPDKTEYVVDVTAPLRDDVFIPTWEDLRMLLLSWHEVLTSNPIHLVNKTFLSGTLSSVIQTIGDFYQVDVHLGSSILTSGLFSKQQADTGKWPQWPFYHAWGKYTLTLQKNPSTGTLEAMLDQEIVFSIEGVPTWITAMYLPDEKKLRLAESWSSYQLLDLKGLTDTTPLTIPCMIGGVAYSCVCRLTGSVLSAQLVLWVTEKKEISTHLPITSLSWISTLPWKQLQCTLVAGKIIRSDRSTWKEVGSILPAVYQSYIQQPRSVYKYPDVIFDGTTPYLLSVQFFGNQRAEITVEHLQRPILGVEKEVSHTPATATQLSGITTQWIVHTNRKESNILLKKNETLVWTIDFKKIHPAQQDSLLQRNPLTQKELPKISGTTSIEGKPVVFVLSNDTGVITVQLSPYNESTDDIVHVRGEVQTTERTIGVWRAKPIFSTTWTIAWASLELIGTKWVAYMVDAPILKRVWVPWVSLVIEKKLQNNITYKITLKNVYDELRFSVDQQDWFPDGWMVDVRKRGQQPLPELPKPPSEVLPPEEHDHDEDDDLHDEGHEHEEPEIVVVNPWWKERAEPSNPMLLEEKIIDWYYKNPRLLPGSGPLDLSEVYMQPGKWFTFRLREDDRIFDNDLLTIPLDKITLWTIIKLTGEDGKTRKVRVDIFDKKLAFSIASPWFKRDAAPELIDGVPVLYTPCYPPGVRSAWINVKQDWVTIRGTTWTSRNFHGWLDIAWPRSTDILAATGGEVVYVKDGVPNNTPDKFWADGYAGRKNGYGNTVIIMHPWWYFTSYHHLSPGTITVKPWDNIPAGEKIAKMGNSWQVRSSKKDGTHLHLAYYKLDEAYVQQSLDAGNYAALREDISRTKSNIPKSKFLRLDPEKYLVDDAPRATTPPRWSAPSSPAVPETAPRRSFERSWHPKGRGFPSEVIGNTPQERLDSFVRYMWYDANMLNRIADDNWLDRAIIPAIIRAEHGKWIPRKNNPGNVMIRGTDTLKTYNSIEEWLVGMANTLNGQNLRSYMMLGELNGYARSIAWLPPCEWTNWVYCYATEDIPNRYTNVTNFMSFVYDKKVDYTYKFRTSTRTPTAPESSWVDYLKQQPKSRLPGDFNRKWVQYNGYLPQLAPPVWVDRRHAPWWRLVALKWWQPVLITPNWEVSLSWNSVVVGGVTYQVTTQVNSTDRVYPNAAQFTLLSQ